MQGFEWTRFALIFLYLQKSMSTKRADIHLIWKIIWYGSFFTKKTWVVWTLLLKLCVVKFTDDVIAEKLYTIPSRIDVTSRQLIFWAFFTHNSVISATTFVKKGPNFAPPLLFQAPRLLNSRNQVVQLPITPLFQPPHHSKLENVFDFHMKVWK